MRFKWGPKEFAALESARMVAWQLDVQGQGGLEVGLIVEDVNDLIQGSIDRLNEPRAAYRFERRNTNHNQMIADITRLMDNAELILYLGLVMVSKRNGR
jgi:hypothetical protein